MDTLELSEAEVVEPVSADELVRALPDNMALAFLTRFRQDQGAFLRTADGRVVFQPHDGSPERPAPVRLARTDGPRQADAGRTVPVKLHRLDRRA